MAAYDDDVKKKSDLNNSIQRNNSAINNLSSNKIKFTNDLNVLKQQLESLKKSGASQSNIDEVQKKVTQFENAIAFQDDEIKKYTDENQNLEQQLNDLDTSKEVKTSNTTAPGDTTSVPNNTTNTPTGDTETSAAQTNTTSAKTTADDPGADKEPVGPSVPSGTEISTNAYAGKDRNIFTGVQAGGDLTNTRQKYYQAADKTRGFIMPWDGRFGYSYTSTQSIGNQMPYGEEWVGSPALINPYALIRFDHIAGKNHHKYLLDQRDQAGFRGTIYKPVANMGDFKKDRMTADKNGVVTLNEDQRGKLGVTKTDEVKADESGDLYIIEVDLSQDIWTHGVDEKAEPVSVTLDNIQAGNDIQAENRRKADELRKANELKSKTIQTGAESVNTAKTDKNYTPNQPEFWILRNGWVKCKDANGNEMFVDPAHCDGGNESNSGNIKKTETEESIKELIKATNDMKTKIDKQLFNKSWKVSGHPESRKYLRSSDSKPVLKEAVEPKAENLTNPENWIGKEQFQYRWADFLYCKYYMLIPNNYMVTLRRYPVPVNDNATVPAQDTTKQHLLPVASAVTWMGNQTGNIVGDLMGFSYRMNWGDLQAEINEVQGNEQGSEDSPFGAGVGKWLGILSGGSNFSSASGWDEQRAKFDPYKDGMYANRVYGPVNVVTKTKRRERGLEFEHSINLNFHYTLRSLGGINPKAAMLDILANILALTYNNAGFWGGANRYFPNKPAYPFIGGKKGMDAWYSGNMTGFLDGMADQLTGALSNLGSFVQNLLTNPKEALKSLSSKGTQLWMADKQRGKRPAILGLKALLTGDPVGEWHICIGNPFNPIMMIGNLICTSTKVTFGDQLGMDDFPDEMIVSVTLEHGRPRDKGDIESMFNRGGGRLHYSYFGEDSEYWNKASSTRESNVDCPNCQTKVDDNFTGKQTYMNATSKKSYGGSGAGSGNPVSNAFPQSTGMKKFYSFTNKNAVNLSEKMGFKSGK